VRAAENAGVADAANTADAADDVDVVEADATLSSEMWTRHPSLPVWPGA
jgi:hypothetical protein